MSNGQGISLRNSLLLLFCLFAVFIPAQHSYAAGPTKIKWIRTCGGGDWQHSRWVIGLSNGNKIHGHFNPSQGRTSTYSLILAAYTAGHNVYWENAESSILSVCGVTTDYFLDPNPGNAHVFMVGDP